MTIGWMPMVENGRLSDLSSTRLFVLLKLIIVYTVCIIDHTSAARPSNGHDSVGYGSSRDIQCYSCMSLSYQDNWEQLQSLYNLPNAFTNRCNDPFNERNVGTVNCSTICVALMEPQVQAGVFIGYLYIRGCMNNLLKNGFNQSALRTHRFFTMDMCRNLPRSQLFNPIRDSRMHPYGEVQLCTCYGERCNGAPNRASLPIRNNCHCWQTFIAIILLFVL